MHEESYGNNNRVMIRVFMHVMSLFGCMTLVGETLGRMDHKSSSQPSFFSIVDTVLGLYGVK